MNYKIMIVEDDSDIAELVSRHLQYFENMHLTIHSQKGYTVHKFTCTSKRAMEHTSYIALFCVLLNNILTNCTFDTDGAGENRSSGKE